MARLSNGSAILRAAIVAFVVVTLPAGRIAADDTEILFFQVYGPMGFIPENGDGVELPTCSDPCFNLPDPTADTGPEPEVSDDDEFVEDSHLADPGLDPDLLADYPDPDDVTEIPTGNGFLTFTLKVPEEDNPTIRLEVVDKKWPVTFHCENVPGYGYDTLEGFQVLEFDAYSEGGLESVGCELRAGDDDNCGGQPLDGGIKFKEGDLVTFKVQVSGKQALAQLSAVQVPVTLPYSERPQLPYFISIEQKIAETNQPAENPATAFKNTRVDYTSYDKERHAYGYANLKPGSPVSPAGFRAFATGKFRGDLPTVNGNHAVDCVAMDHTKVKWTDGTPQHTVLGEINKIGLMYPVYFPSTLTIGLPKYAIYPGLPHQNDLLADFRKSIELHEDFHKQVYLAGWVVGLKKIFDDTAGKTLEYLARPSLSFKYNATDNSFFIPAEYSGEYRYETANRTCSAFLETMAAATFERLKGRNGDAYNFTFDGYDNDGNEKWKRKLRSKDEFKQMLDKGEVSLIHTMERQNALIDWVKDDDDKLGYVGEVCGWFSEDTTDIDKPNGPYFGFCDQNHLYGSWARLPKGMQGKWGLNPGTAIGYFDQFAKGTEGGNTYYWGTYFRVK